VRVVVLCGPPCAGKTTLVHRLTHPGDWVLDYDDLARALGSPARWIHPEPYRTMAEQDMQHRIHSAYHQPCDGTAWVIRTCPKPHQRAALAHHWQASVYVLDPGEQQCRHRATLDARPRGTLTRIGDWYHAYRPWTGDRDLTELLSTVNGPREQHSGETTQR